MATRKASLPEFLEVEAWVRPQGSTLKSLFDNLRNYPLLAIFFFVTRLLNEQPGIFAAVSGVVFAIYTLLLAAFTVLQTAVLMTSFFVWLVFEQWRRHDPTVTSEPTSRATSFLEVVRWSIFGLFLVTTTIACFITAGRLIHVFSTLKLQV